LNFLLALIFGAEAPIVRRVDIPIGVSIMALGRKPGIDGDRLASTNT
jgi:hypothetical protein